MTNGSSFRQTRRGVLVGGTAMLLATNACGWILYPERKGRSGGKIDVGVLIIDLLWLLPGIIPGAICLAVDFTTGCIYEGSASAANDPAENPELAVASVEVDGQVVAAGELDSDRHAQLRWIEGSDEPTARNRGKLIIRRADGRAAEAFIRDLI